MIDRDSAEHKNGQATQLEVTIITVGIEADDAERLVGLGEDLGWRVHPRIVNHQVSSRKRPHLPAHLLQIPNLIAFVDFDSEQGEESVQYLRQILGARLCAISVSAEPDKVLAGMRAGCIDFLPKPLAAQDCVSAMRRFEERAKGATAATRTHGTVLALLGAKGGVGTTTIAVHLSAYLAQECAKKVLLIDNQAQYGHVCIYLGIDGALFHFQEVVRNVYRLDSELLRGYIAKHPSGVDVLSSPDVGEAARVMHPEDVRETLEFLRSEYDFIVVDCAGRLDDISRAVVDSAEQAYVVATPEISALRDLSRYVDELAKQADEKKVKVVINRFSSQFAVSLAEIEKAIRMPVTFSVPNSFLELVRSANLGTPLPASMRNGFTTELCRWARSLTGEAESWMAGDALLHQRGKRKSFGAAWQGLKTGTKRFMHTKGALNG